MSPKMTSGCASEVETPILAWFPSGSATPSSPSVFPSQVPVVAISTAPGLPSVEFQQVTGVAVVVVGISGEAHQDATRSGSPPSKAETICHGGTRRYDGFEISSTPLDSLVWIAVLLVDTFPRLFTSA